MNPANCFTCPSTLPTPIACAPMKADWKARIRTLWWAREFDGLDRLNDAERTRVLSHRKLIEKILSFGGEEVCMPPIEDDLDDLVSRGVFLYGESAKMVKGRPSQCHVNSSNLWEKNPDSLRLMTGYALSLDGMWRQHSWCLQREDDRIVETTEPRLAYFGFVMSDSEAKRFAFDNLY